MGNPNRYTETVEYLYEKLPVFSRIGKAALKPDLSNTLKLCAALGNPEAKFPSVHIAGTNGKGSTSHGLAAVLQEAGYKVGLYTSPHLVDFRERIRINGVPVAQDWVVRFVEQHKALIEEVQPSFFEITVAMAFAAFAEEAVDIAVIETGLGGRLDSTNVITPLLSIITNISYDHKDLLGNTLTEIAAEKAGIIKHGVPVVIGEQHDETERVFFEHSVHQQATLHYAQALWGMVRVGQDATRQHYKAVHNGRRELYDLYTDLTGNYQAHNIKTILTAAEILTHNGYRLTTQGVIAALANVKRTTGLMGRWQCLQQQPTVICDVAHNPAGLTEVVAQFRLLGTGEPGGTGHVVVGFVKDKDVQEALALLPKEAQYYFCNADMPRALPAADLHLMATEAGLVGNAYGSVASALAAAYSQLQIADKLLVTGSFFIVGDALQAWESMHGELTV